MAFDGDVLAKMAKFLYLGDVVRSVGGVQEAVTRRIKCRWKKFKDISSVLCKRVVSLKLRGSMYRSCARSYGV